MSNLPLSPVPSPALHQGRIQIRDAAVINGSTACPEYDFLTVDVSGSHRLNICHPAYPVGDDVLLTLSALDHAEGGLHHGFVLSVCEIISDHLDNGYLSLDRESGPLQAGPDDVLKAGRNYYYHVPNPAGEVIEPIRNEHEHIQPYKWPVVATFQDWKFPVKLPRAWAEWRDASQTPIFPSGTASQSNYTLAVRIRDVSCRVTQHYTGTEAVHLCPERERNWFLANNMQRYKTYLDSDFAHFLKDPANMLLLRSDLHKPFDDRLFVFFPKGPQCTLVLHSLRQIPDLSQIYHNAKLHAIPHCSPEYLLTRLAWSIFPLLAGFLGRRTPRHVIVVNDETGERVARELSDMRFVQERAAKARSQSPQKRKRAAELNNNDTPAHEAELASDGGVIDSQDSTCRDRVNGRPVKRPRRTSDDLLSYSADLPTTPTALESSPQLPSTLEKKNENKNEKIFEWYPGANRIEELRRAALELQRPHDYRCGAAKASRDPICADTRLDPSLREQLEDMGFEIIDDDI